MLRAAPVGDFLSFPAEMTRISKNLIKYTMEDLGNSMKVVKDADGRIISTTVENPELLKSATKRLAGMTTIGLAGDYGYNLSKDIFNISDEEDNSLRMTAPRWETNQQRIYLSPINKDRNGHLGVDYINFGPIDPFSFIRSAAVGTHDLLLNNKEYNPLEEQKILYGIIDNTLSPFLSPSMVTEAGIDLLQGRIPKDPEAADYFGNVFGTLAEPFLPGFVPTGRKTIDYFRSGVTSSFSTIKSGEVDPLAWAGLVRKRQDLTAGARFNFNPAFADINKASSLTNDLLKDPNETDPNKIFDGFRKTQVQRLEGFKDLRNLIQIYNELGMSTADIIKALSVNDLLKVQGKNINLVDAANDNYFIPYFPKLTMSKKDLTQLSKKQLESMLAKKYGVDKYLNQRSQLLGLLGSKGETDIQTGFTGPETEALSIIFEKNPVIGSRSKAEGGIVNLYAGSEDEESESMDQDEDAGMGTDFSGGGFDEADDEDESRAGDYQTTAGGDDNESTVYSGLKGDNILKEIETILS
jgi:hypothetical protein